jgi:hypothetical protein
MIDITSGESFVNERKRLRKMRGIKTFRGSLRFFLLNEGKFFDHLFQNDREAKKKESK